MADWAGLLKWSTKFHHDGQSTRSPRSEEDMGFLRNAIKSIFHANKDPYELVEEAKPRMNSDQTEEILSGLGVLHESLTNEPEMARNIPKMGLVQLLSKLITHQDVSVRELAACVLTEVLGNNQSAQRAFWQNGLLDIILNMLKDEQHLAGEDVPEHHARYYSRLFSVLSGLVRHEDDVERDFVNKGGANFVYELAERAIHSRLSPKVLNMLDHIENVINPKLA